MFKLPKLITLVIASLFFAFTAYAQQESISLKYSDVKLSVVLKEIQKQSSFDFIYNNTLVDVNTPVSIETKGAKINEVMDKLLKDLPISYKIIEKQVTLFPKEFPNEAPKKSPAKIIEGEILEKGTGEPLPGATVQVEGSTVYAIADFDGKFTIDVPAGSILIINTLGMSELRVPAKSGGMVIELSPDGLFLEEVVVTGITKTDKRLFTGASDKLTASDIQLPGMADVGRALEGRSAGVSVQNVSGTFGTAPKIRVRGATSILGSSKPLWVVDGVALEDVVEISSEDLATGDATTLISSAIAGLNAEDIESFQILKDGSATSIYGAKAMAGVIVVTTKKGVAGVNRISYSGELTYRMIPSYSNFNIMNSQDQMGIYQEMQQKGWLNFNDLANSKSSGVYGKMYQLINTYDATSGLFGIPNTEEARNAYLREAEYRNTDWFNILFNNNVMQSHSVSLSSGTEKSSYYASISALVDPGWTKSSNVNRYTANINASYKVFKWFDVNIISSGSYRKQKAPGTLSQTTDVVSGEVRRDFDINPYSYALNTSRAMDPNTYYTSNYAPFNILHELDNNYIDVNVADVKFQTELKFKLYKGLELSALGAVRYQTTSQEHNITDFSNQALAYRAMGTATIRDANPYLYSDPDNPYALPITVLPEGGIYKKTDNTLLSYDFRSVLTYNETFKGNHIVNFNGGMELTSAHRHGAWFRGWGLQYSLGEIPFYVYEVFKKGVEEGSDYYGISNKYKRNTAFFANGTYSYKARYTISGTIRYEGSNSLGKSRTARWLPTWNVSGAWNMHEEKFFKNLEPGFSHFTLKASYSLTADRGPTYVTNSSVVIRSSSPWRPFASSQETALYISSLENQDLTYEKKKEFNVGASMGFVDNRINLEADYYLRNNYDLIGITTSQGIGGEVSKYGNVASMKSTGLEISLSTVNVKTKDFTWKTDIVYSHINNQITELQNYSRVIDLVSGSGYAMKGYPVRALFSIPFEGLTGEGLPTFTGADGNTTITGINFQLRDTGNGELDFLKYEGPTDPTDMGSFGNMFQWKGWKLNAFITYSWGNVVRLDPVFRSSYNDLSAMTKEFNDRWMQSGDEAYTDIPVLASVRQVRQSGKLSYAYNAYNYSTARIAKGDFIRMKEISLSYDFPKKMIEKIKLSGLSMRIQATNLFLIYADKKLNGQDPEFFNAGGVATPIPRQFTFTLRLSL